MSRWSPTMRMWRFGLQDNGRHYGSIALRVEKVDIGYGWERDREREQRKGMEVAMVIERGREEGW